MFNSKRKKNNTQEKEADAIDAKTIDLAINKPVLETINVSEKTCIELIRIKDKNECESIDEAIAGIIYQLEQYQKQDTIKNKKITHIEIYYDDETAETIHKEVDVNVQA